MTRGTGRPAGSKKKVHLNNVVVPAALASLSLVVLIAVLNYLNFDLEHGIGASAIIFASFAGSAFLLFMVPRSHTASIRRFVKSYVIGAAFGSLGFLMLPSIGIYYTSAVVLFLASIVMVLTDSMHPPAISLIFAYVLYDVGLLGNVLVIAGVVLLVVIRVFLERAIFIIEKDIKKYEGR